MSVTLSALQKQRRDTAANWTSANPTLLAGEIGIESDTSKWKVGDGTTAWTSLAYIPGLSISAYPLVNADISATAEIAVSKLADGTARQLLQTDAAGTGVEWASNIDVPGTLDVTGAATFDAGVTIQGDLTVNGTTTTIDTQNLIVEDKNVVIGQVTTPTDVTADGGGITLKGSTDKTINWVDATDAWTFSEHVNLASGKGYYINGTQVLSSSTLGSGVTGSSLTSVGTIGTGVWQGTTIGTAYGGTGIAGSYTDGQLLIGKTDGTLAKAAITAGNGIDIANGDGSIAIDVDLKANGGLVIEATELAVDLSASNITGTLTAGDGGTGQTTYSNGQLLIGKTDGTLAKATLTAGSNVSITNGDGSVSIASTDTTYTAGDGLDLVGTTFSTDLKANGGLVIESTELAVDLSASSITGTLGVADGGTGQTSYTDGQLLIGNSTGNTLSKATLTAGTGISITNGAGSISIASTVSGGLPTTGGTLTGDLLMDNQSDVRFGEATANGSNWVALQGPANIAANVTWTLPSTDGTNGQVLSTNGSGALSWATATSTTDKIEEGNTSAEVIDTGSDGRFVVTTEGTERLRVDSSGRVGIGSTAPSTLLHLASSDPVIRLQDTDTNAFGQIVVDNSGNVTIQADESNAQASSSIRFNVDGSERVRLDSSGRLLVGTSTARSFSGHAGSQIQLEGTSYSASTLSLINNQAATDGPYLLLGHSRGTSIGSATAVVSGDQAGAIWFAGADGTNLVSAARIECFVDGTPGANDMPGRLVFSTTADGASSPTERMRIASTGRFTFEVNSTTGGFYINSWSSGAGNSTVKYNTATGQLTFDSSSHLIKEDIKNCPYGIKEVKQLQPRIYKRKDSNEIEIGFISDEMREVIPELAPLGPKSGLTGNSDDTEEIPISVNYDKFTAVLTAALQETIAKIETLEAKVAALEAS